MRAFVVLLCIFLPLVEAILRLKLQTWFPYYRKNWIDASALCRLEIHNYLINNRTACGAPCACAADCILGVGATATIQSNFASAQVLLGLTPPILAYFGPTLSEMAVVSSRRPFLAILLGLGSPAINLLRLHSSSGFHVPLGIGRTRVSRMWPIWLSRQSASVRILVEILSHLLAMAAIANTAQNSVNLDLRTISGWRCGALFMPVVWSLLAVVPHMWAMLSIRVQLLYQSRVKGAGRDYSPFSTRNLICSKSFQRLDPFIADGPYKVSMIADVILWFATICAIIHMVFGVLDLSSLIFVDALEALNVFVRYAVSAFVCQIVLLMQLAIVRQELRQQKP